MEMAEGGTMRGSLLNPRRPEWNALTARLAPQLLPAENREDELEGESQSRGRKEPVKWSVESASKNSEDPYEVRWEQSRPPATRHDVQRWSR